MSNLSDLSLPGYKAVWMAREKQFGYRQGR